MDDLKLAERDSQPEDQAPDWVVKSVEALKAWMR